MRQLPQKLRVRFSLSENESKAIGILPALRAEADVVYERLLAGISGDEVAVFKRLLATMSANL